MARAICHIVHNGLVTRAHRAESSGRGADTCSARQRIAMRIRLRPEGCVKNSASSMGPGASFRYSP
jgi:hypothetical protein